MPISGFDLKIKIRAIQKNFPFSFFSFFFFFQTITIRYQNFLFRITHPVHANYTVVYPRTHPRYTQYIQIHLFYTSRYIACTRETARTSIHERRVVCGSPFKTRIVHDPENVAGFSTSLGASAGSSASGNLPIRSRNHRTSCFPENVEKSFPRSESRLGTPPTPQTFNVCRLNVWNVWYIVFDEGSITTSFFVAIFSFDLPLYLSSSGNKRKERNGGLIILRGGGGLVCRSSPRSGCRFKKYIFSYCEILIRVSSRKSFSKVCETLLYSRF